MIRIERAIRHIARERDHFLLRLELCGSERQQPSGYLRLEIPISPERKSQLLAVLEGWEKEGGL